MMGLSVEFDFGFVFDFDLSFLAKRVLLARKRFYRGVAPFIRDQRERVGFSA